MKAKLFWGLVMMISMGNFSFAQIGLKPAPVDSRATPETKALFYNLRNMMGKGILFGHQHTTSYGVGWENELNRSDVKDVTGKFPAMYGWDISKLGKSANIDGTTFENIRRDVLLAYKRGGLHTISWHEDNPQSGGNAWDTTRAVRNILPGGARNEFFKAELDKVAAFILSLKTEDGTLVPVIFRPYHEHTGSWFWWGKNFCTPDEYKALWKFTVEYLRDVKGVHNILYAYSTDRVNTDEEYMERYPGDKYIDVLGCDDYWDFVKKTDIEKGLNLLRIVVNESEKRGKIPALTEFGYENIPEPMWWTDFILEPIKNDPIAKKITFMLTWRNASNKNHYVPYPGHSSAPDFIKFEADPYTLFEGDIINMYKMPEQ